MNEDIRSATVVTRSMTQGVAPVFSTGRAPPHQGLTVAVPEAGARHASDLLQCLFRSFNGTLALRLWDGTALRLGRTAGGDATPGFTLMCRSQSVVRSIVLGCDPLLLVEAYFPGDIGEIGVHQVLATKRVAGLTSLPLTRQHMFPQAAWVGNAD